MKILSPLLQRALLLSKKYEKEVTLQGVLYSIYEVCEEVNCDQPLPSTFKKKRRKRKQEGVIPESLMEYLYSTSSGPIVDILHIIESVSDDVSDDEFQAPRKHSKNPVLELACKNLVTLASSGELDPIIGRDKELDRLIKCLGRRKKNNAIIVGQAGVGKTGLVEKLAHAISDGNVPDHLKDMPIYEMSVMKLATMRTERVQIILEQLETAEVILFIDEIHLIMDHRFKDLAQILKPLVMKGSLRTIGATTREEYISSIVPDDAFRRRFEMIDIEESSHDDTIQILHGLSHLYESFHRVQLSDDVIKTIVSFSGRYLPGNMPDKAIDLMESVCSSVVAGAMTKKIKLHDHDFIGYHNAKKKHKKHRKDITVEDVKEVIEMTTGISNICDITYEEILSRMKSDTVGMDSQLAEIASHIAKSHNIYRNRGCLASMLFTGPEGSGKEHVARSLCRALYGSEKPFLIVDMDYYSSHYNISRLIGAPPGYLGYEHGGGILPKFVSDHPSGIIFLDKLESDDSTATTIFRRAVEDGYITTASGLRVDMRNYVIIGSFKGKDRSKSMGFQKDAHKEPMPDVSFLRPIIRTKKPEKGDIKRIIDMKINNLIESLKSKGVQLIVTKEAIEMIASKVTDTSSIDPLISSYILDQITFRDKDIIFTVENDHIIKENDADGRLSNVRQRSNTKVLI